MYIVTRMLLEITVSLVLLAIGIWIVNRVVPSRKDASSPVSSILLQKELDETVKRGEVHIYPQSAKCGVSKC